MKTEVHLGFEVGTGAPVSVPVRHLAVTGQTQLSGKTTTLESLVTRSGRCAIAFVTKRAEASFTGARVLKPYFKHRADWQFVASILEATMREKMRFERSWIMRACKGATTLADVQRNVKDFMTRSRGLAADVYLTLDHYLDIVVPQIGALDYTTSLDLTLPGINVMNLVDYSMELQALVIRSVLEWVYEKERDTLVIIPEAWEFIPQQRGSPVLLACEQLIRKGGASHNFVWLDSQDIAGVHKNILRSVSVWILGVQREANEVKRVLAHIPGKKPKINDIMELQRGQFFVCYGAIVVKTYVQPKWLAYDMARDIAIADQNTPAQSKEAEVDAEEAKRLTIENNKLRGRCADLEATIDKMRAHAARNYADGIDKPDTAVPASMDAIYAEMKRRAENDPGVLALMSVRPEICVAVQRRRIEASGETLFGKLAAMIAEGFFEEPRTGNAAYNELTRRGQSTAKPNVYRECDKLAAQGFLTKEDGGYQSVKGMKINIVEAAA